MNKESVCFIDIDNVLGDLDLQVRLMTGYNIKGLNNKIDLSNDEKMSIFVSTHLKNFSDMFWRTIPVKQDAHKLLDDCLKRYDSIKLISRYEPPIGIPHRFLYVREAKIRWTMQHFGNIVDIDDIIITKHNKHQHMETNKINVLIDHNINEIRQWRQFGGIGFMYNDYNQFNYLMKYQNKIQKCIDR